MAVWPALHQSHRGSSADSQAGQQAYVGGGDGGVSSLGEDWCRTWLGWLWSSSGGCRGFEFKFRSAPSSLAPRRILAPAFPRYLAVLHRHWLSPPWSGPGRPGVHIADQSEWQTDASPGGLHPVAEYKMNLFKKRGHMNSFSVLTRFTPKLWYIPWAYSFHTNALHFHGTVKQLVSSPALGTNP